MKIIARHFAEADQGHGKPTILCNYEFAPVWLGSSPISISEMGRQWAEVWSILYPERNGVHELGRDQKVEKAIDLVL
jgi:hypothetical protein